MRLPRPHIPLSVRIEVALRQLNNTMRRPTWGSRAEGESARNYLGKLLAHLAHQLTGDWNAKLHLDHDPALGLRKKLFAWGVHVDYEPRANDPNSLLYRSKDAHHVKTNVRGDGAQRSDTARMTRERKRLRKKRRPKHRWPKGRKIRSRGFDKRGKKPWKT